MAPPSATQETVETGASILTYSHDKPQDGTAPLETESQAKKPILGPQFPSPPKFTDKYAEREYQKGRLALAFRIFAKFGFDEGVAGHITLRVCFLHTLKSVESRWRERIWVWKSELNANDT